MSDKKTEINHIEGEEIQSSSKDTVVKKTFKSDVKLSSKTKKKDNSKTTKVATASAIKKLVKALKVGSQVKLLVGKKENRGKTFTVKKIKSEKVFLDGYNLVKRSAKITQNNTNNYNTVHHGVHISNVKLIQE